MPSKKIVKKPLWSSSPKLEDQEKLSEFDCDVVREAWLHRYTTGQLVEAVKLQHAAADEAAINRSIRKALRHGLLLWNPVPQHKAEARLRQACPKLRDAEIKVELDSEAVCFRAAHTIMSKVDEFLASNRTRMVIANAGGRTLKASVDCLQRLVPIPPDLKSKTLTFVSLNAAEQQDRFDECANFLSVRMAQIYSARHIALVRDESVSAAYEAELDRIDLAISSVGGDGSLLSDWLDRKVFEVPGSVGDICFNLVDELAQPIILDPDIEAALQHELRPNPNWHKLMKLFRERKVLLLLRGPKEKMASALLRASFLDWCIIERNLAEHLTRNAT